MQNKLFTFLAQTESLRLFIRRARFDMDGLESIIQHRHPRRGARGGCRLQADGDRLAVKGGYIRRIAAEKPLKEKIAYRQIGDTRNGCGDRQRYRWRKAENHHQGGIASE
ncbi:hypothetical protein [Rhizobium sp. G21]|uniref:hypothetical protein n=1 Tax=Rhizobium sp. G21 TaxID=2758439 RepID=UPI0016032CA9|nr:hypothetical protein [Rhizobium sp. G21]